MSLQSLTEFITTGNCSSCHGETAFIEPLSQGKVSLGCSSSDCNVAQVLELPRMEKKLLYLDTSTVSHIAKALSKPEPSPYKVLYEKLCEAIGLHVLACTVSPIADREIELSKDHELISRVAWRLTTVETRSESDVRMRQLHRALGLFLESRAALSPDCLLPPTDAIEGKVDKWLSGFKISAAFPRIPEVLEERRRAKSDSLQSVPPIYQRYETEDKSFDEMRLEEAAGFGRGLLWVFADTHQRRIRAMTTTGRPLSLVELGGIMPTIPELLAKVIQNRTACDYKHSLELMTQFLLSKHVSSLPTASIGGHLHAALALASRGRKGRKLKASDGFDIDHIATFAPYFDYFVVDSYFQSICNSRSTPLRTARGTQFIDLSPASIPAFVSTLDGLIGHGPCVALTELTYPSEGDTISKSGRRAALERTLESSYNRL